MGSHREKAKYNKVVTAHDTIFGTAGDVASCQQLVEWWTSGGEFKKAPKGSWEMLVWKHRHIPRYYNSHDNFCGYDVHLPHTIGSGGLVASIALDCGLTPHEAMKKAYKRDVYSSGPTRTLDVESFFNRCLNAKKGKG